MLPALAVHCQGTLPSGSSVHSFPFSHTSCFHMFSCVCLHILAPWLPFAVVCGFPMAYSLGCCHIRLFALTPPWILSLLQSHILSGHNYVRAAAAAFSCAVHWLCALPRCAAYLQPASHFTVISSRTGDTPGNSKSGELVLKWQKGRGFCPMHEVRSLCSSTMNGLKNGKAKWRHNLLSCDWHNVNYHFGNSYFIPKNVVWYQCQI